MKTRQAQKIKRKETKPEAELQASRGLQVSGLPPSHGKPLVVSYAKEKVSQPPPTGAEVASAWEERAGEALAPGAYFFVVEDDASQTRNS